MAEAFVVCCDYCPPLGYVPTMANPLLDHKYGMSMNLLKYTVNLLKYTGSLLNTFTELDYK